MRIRVRGAILLFLFVLPSPLGAQDEKETVFWESVECESVRQVELYLEMYPEGAYVAAAGACLEGQLGLDRATRVLVQQGLAALDYAPGPADGQFGPSTRAALRGWQTEKGFAETGYLTREQADTLMAQGREAVAEAERQAENRRRADAERRRKAEEERQQAEEAERQRLAQLPREVLNSLGMEFVLIEPGSFEMGAPATETPEWVEPKSETLHRVTLTQPYYLGKYEVTRGEFGRFVAATGYTTENVCDTYEYDGFFSGGWFYRERSGRSWRVPGYQQSERDPVVCVDWEDAQAYTKWVSGETGDAYRLPTEAEWEYAARAGTQTAYHFGNTANRLGQYGWYEGNSGNNPHPVGQKRPNAWGLHDMHGNVWEWVQDWYGDYPSGHVTDPRGPSTGPHRAYRGGSWFSSAEHCRAAYRYYGMGPRTSSLGFRLTRTP